MSLYLLTFPDGHATLFTDRAEAERARDYWPHHAPTIRDLDQEARDLAEAKELLRVARLGLAEGSAIAADVDAFLVAQGQAYTAITTGGVPGGGDSG